MEHFINLNITAKTGGSFVMKCAGTPFQKFLSQKDAGRTSIPEPFFLALV
jgi:hypothetical protein